jgi:hypothetical protein
MPQVHAPLPTHHLEDEINRTLSHQTGIPVSAVEHLRAEFRKLGRNPMDAAIELLALENGYDEDRVKVSGISIILFIYFSISTNYTFHMCGDWTVSVRRKQISE